MKKLLLTGLTVVLFFGLSAVSAAAVVNDTVKVGLWYGSDALFSANLENAEGDGYEFGYFDEDRDFVPLGETEERTISMTAAGTVYMSSGGVYSGSVPSGTFRTLGAWHAQLDGYDSFEEAQEAARDYDGYPAWIEGEYVVRVGSYDSRREAEDALEDLGERGDAVQSSSTGVLVTVTKTTDILFEFDGRGAVNLGVQPGGRHPVTWFKGYKYRGGFEYARVTGGNLNVINVVDLEDYVKGVIPYEMNGDWPLAALEAQAVCARSFVCGNSKHLGTYGFDVCAGSDCQIYRGEGSGGAAPSDRSNEAVDNTAGECLYYDGEVLKDAVYHSSNGGATEDAENVWGGKVGYLQGKEDPYEGQISIPDYAWSVTYTAAELTWILQQKGKDIGTIRNVYVSEYTPLGNVSKVTFVDSAGNVLTVTGDACRTIFYSSTYNKSVRSLRFSINGGGPAGGGIYVNGTGQRLSSLDGAAVLSGGGTLGQLSGDSAAVVTSSGTGTVTASGGQKAPSRGESADSFTITGTGNGHNVGLSQYGARAMAELGHDYQEILEFYYTDVTIG